MSDSIKLSVEVDTKKAVADLDRLEDASKDAGTELDKLGPDAAGADRNLEQLGGAADTAGRKLDGLGLDADTAGRKIEQLDRKAAGTDPTVTVEIDFDEGAAKRAGDSMDDLGKKARASGDGLGFQNDALRNLTGPLGNAIGPALDLGDAFEGLGAVAGGLGGKLGLSQSAVGKLAGAVGAVGIVVAAGAAAWTLYQQKQQKAEEVAKELLKVQEALAAGEYLEAAKSFEEQYRGTIRAAEAFGFSVQDVVSQLKGEKDILGELDRLIEQYGQNGANLDLGKLTQVSELRENLGLATEAFADNEVQLESSRGTVGLLAASFRGVGKLGADELGVISEEAKRAEQRVKDLESAFDDLTRKLEQQSAIESVRDAFDAIEDAAVESFIAAAEGASNASRLARDYEQAVRDGIAAVLGLEAELDGIPPDTLKQIAVTVRDGDLPAARALIETVAAGLPPVQIGLDTSYLTARLEEWARTAGPGSSSGGPTRPPQGTTTSVSSGPVTVNNYYPPRVNPSAVAQADRTLTRIQGPR